jgi:hypothetical protein
MSWFKSMIGQASWAGAAGGTSALAKWGSMGAGGRYATSAGAGAIMGAGWGATGGRDMGQSRLSGAMGGALQGALTGAGLYGAGRYGGAALNAGRKTNSLLASHSMGTRMRASGSAAGQAAWRSMKYDAASASGYIGKTKTRAINAFKGLAHGMY